MSELSSIIPAPVACEPGEGSFRFNQETCIATEPGLEKEAGVLAAWLSRVPGIERVKIVSGNSDNHKPLAIPSEPGSNKPATIRLSLESALCLRTPEAYVLEITPSSIQITAAESAGIIRGAASLWQLALGKSCEE